ncbi:MAG TPA: chloride channel protein [Actinomycetota bacterium]|nr:chloride channel protein [Actinomycetota bacterium]
MSAHEPRRFWLLVLAVGVAGGLAGAAYVTVMKAATSLLGPHAWSRPTHLLILALAGGGIALLTKVLGNPGDVELLVNNIHVGGRSDLRELRSLIPVSLLGIAAGSAIGPEAPLVQTTGEIGNWAAIRARMPAVEARTLTITGMAAGFTVLFGAPLGSAIFALEILHRRGLQYYEALLPAAAGSLAGFAISMVTAHFGLTPIWRFPAVASLHPRDLAAGVLAGVGGAAIAAAFTYATHAIRRGFRRIPIPLRPVVGGLALGALAWVSPFALTYGEGQIQAVAGTRLAVSTLLVAVAVKLLASSTIVSAGWRGGFIIPLFFMGAALGAAAAPALGINQVVLMLALMAAANVGVTKTPLGSCLIVAAMAGYRLLPPVLAASLVSLFLTSRVSMIETQRERESEEQHG